VVGVVRMVDLLGVWVLDATASPTLNLTGKLLPGQKTILSLSIAFQTATWLTHIGLGFRV
jgi:hypothetical protein